MTIESLKTELGRRIVYVAIGSILTLAVWAGYDWLNREPPPDSVFSNIYTKKLWGVNADGEGHSGSGSTLEATVIYRVFLQDFLEKHKITSVVDAGCGDWECSRALDWSGIEYRGYDIVEEVIAKNRKRYAAPNIQFFVANVLTDPLPAADLLICKHVLQHLPNRDVLRFRPQMEKYKHVLLVNSVDSATMSAPNNDIRLGDYRPLDPTRAPFYIVGKKILTYWDGDHMQQVIHARP
jgi:SAM-dependent methyltransferase